MENCDGRNHGQKNPKKTPKKKTKKKQKTKKTLKRNPETNPEHFIQAILFLQSTSFFPTKVDHTNLLHCTLYTVSFYLRNLYIKHYVIGWIIPVPLKRI